MWLKGGMFSDVFRKSDEPKAETPVRTSEDPAKKETKSMSSTSGAVLSEDVEFKGTIVFNSSMELNGKFQGEIIADGPLTVGEAAIVVGDIKAKSTVLLKGKMRGNIEAADRVELTSTAQLFGDVKAPKFSIKEGSLFVGTSDTSGGKKSPDNFQNMFSKLGKSDGNSSSPSSAAGSGSLVSQEPKQH